MPAQQLEIPKSRTTSTSTAALLVTMPACDDRIAADLRTRVLDAGWVSNARLCLELRSWMVANNLSVLEASRKIGVPHITADVMQRLSECRRPIGASVGVWQDLLNLVVDVEVARRITVSAAAAYHGRPVTAKPAPQPATPPAAPSLADLRAAIISEIGRPRKPGVRTVKTAQMVLDIAAKYSPLRGSKHANKLGLPQTYALASALAEDEKQATARDTHTPAVQVDDRDRDRWYFRLEAYAPRIAEIRAATQPQPASAPTPIAPTHKAAALRDVKFVGRPRLLPGGAELSATITRMVQETIRIGPTDDLWSAGVAALNGDA